MPPMTKFWIVLGLEAVVALVVLVLLDIDPFVAIAVPVFLAFRATSLGGEAANYASVSHEQ